MPRKSRRHSPRFLRGRRLRARPAEPASKPRRRLPRTQRACTATATRSGSTLPARCALRACA
eukprot:8820305-Lingulodinium_polyedra.AAC.1